MKNRWLLIFKIVFGLVMLWLGLYEVISRGIFTIFFIFGLCPISLFIGGIMLLLDATFSFQKDKVPGVFYRNIALCMLFVAVNSLFIYNYYSEMHELGSLGTDFKELIVYGNPIFFIIGRIIIPLIFVVFYIFGSEDGKLNFNSYLHGLPLFVGVMFVQVAVSLMVSQFVYYDCLIGEPIEYMNNSFAKIETGWMVVLIALSVLVANIILIYLNRIKYKFVETSNNKADTKEKAN